MQTLNKLRREELSLWLMCYSAQEMIPSTDGGQCYKHVAQKALLLVLTVEQFGIPVLRQKEHWNTEASVSQLLGTVFTVPEITFMPWLAHLKGVVRTNCQLYLQYFLPLTFFTFLTTILCCNFLLFSCCETECFLYINRVHFN